MKLVVQKGNLTEAMAATCLAGAVSLESFKLYVSKLVTLTATRPRSGDATDAKTATPYEPHNYSRHSIK